jgi:hypothetical protein
VNPLESKLQEILPGYAIQFGEDPSFERPPSGAWCRLTDKHGSASHLELAGERVETAGLAIVDVFGSGGAGEDLCQTVAELVVSETHLLILGNRKFGYQVPGYARPSYPSEAPGWTHWKAFLPYTRQEVRARAS